MSRCEHFGKTKVVIDADKARVFLSEDSSWEGLQVVSMSFEEFSQIAEWVTRQVQR